MLRTRGEYALSVGGMSPNPLNRAPQTAGYWGIGLGLFLTSRVAIEGDAWLPAFDFEHATGAGQVVVLPFRDAYATSCVVPYVEAGGLGSEALGFFGGPTLGGGARYYFGGGLGVGLDLRAVFPQLRPVGTNTIGTVYMITFKLLLQPDTK
jgi:hypothetical protein